MLISFPFYQASPRYRSDTPVRTEPRFPSAEGLWYMAPREDNYRLKILPHTPYSKHLQILERCFRPCIFIKCRNIMIHHQDNRFSHTSLPGPEGVRTAGIHALLLKFPLSIFLSAFRCSPPGTVSGRNHLHPFRWRRPSK